MNWLSIVAVVTLSGVVVGATVFPLSYPPVSGTSLSGASGDLVSVQSLALNVSGGGVDGALVTLVNNDTEKHNGRLTVQLRTDSNLTRSVEATFFVKKRGGTVDCGVSFDKATARSGLRVSSVSVNTTPTVAKRNADCRSRGKGNGGNGNGGNGGNSQRR
jgi:hypothetical protein